MKKPWESEKRDLSYIPESIAHSPFLNALIDELVAAEQQWPPIHSLHEGYGVLVEEVAEFFEEVRKRSIERDHAHIRKELAQVAAVAWRIVLDLYERKETP